MAWNAARIAGAILLLASPGFAGEVRGECDIRFQVTSTLHDFPGKARCLPFRAVLALEAGGRTGIPVIEAEVPVDGMDTGNRTRDGQMREMFGSDRFPRIRGTVRDVDVDGIRRSLGSGGEGRATVDLALRIRDVDRTVPAVVTNLREEGGAVRFDLDFTVSLKEFGLKAPTVLFFIRVGDRVDVTGNVRLVVTSKE